MAESVTASRELRETCEVPAEWAGPADAMGRPAESFEIAAFSEGMERVGMRFMGGIPSHYFGGAGIVELHPR